MAESGEGRRKELGGGEAIDDPRIDGARPADGDAPTTRADGNNRFAFTLYEQLRRRPGNLAFSPLSIRTALSLALAGARGETAAQMTRALCVPEGDGMRHADVAAPVQQLQERGNLALTVANSLWAQEGAPLQPAFLDIVAQHYEGAMQLVDFRCAPDEAKAAINRWVEEATQGKIAGVIPSGAPSPLTRLLLVNAVTFTARWASEFLPYATCEQPFHLETGGTVPVPLMRQRTRAGYLRADGFAVLDLPYAGESLSLLVMLPDANDGLGALEASLSAAVLNDVITHLQPQPVDVQLPWFTTTTDAVDLRDALSALGMPLPFDAGRADFSGIDGHAPGHEEAPFLSAVFHKVYVKVYEKGTEAAAVTATIGPGGRPLGGPKPPPVPDFRADRPFLYAIRDRQSGALVFLGRLVKPTHDSDALQVRNAVAPEPVPTFDARIGRWITRFPV
jgi:serpin B